MREQIPDGRFVCRHFPDETPAPNETVQVWCCDLDDPCALPYCDESILASEELQRAGSFRLERHRQLFIRRRALRRFLLGRFLGVSPRSLCLVETSLGKPQLAQSSPARCEFSTSHSGNIFAMAMAPEAEIGVDVEALRLDWNLEPVAAMCLERQRVAQLETFPALDRQKQILRFWSLREAFAKASGHGIARPHDGEMPAARVWDCISGADTPLPGWNWIQQWHRIGNHDAVISIVRKERQGVGALQR